MKSKIFLGHLYIILSAIASIIYLLINLYGGKYTYMFLLPFTFLLTYLFYINLLKLKNKRKITMLIVVFFYYIRFVVIPVYSATSVSYFSNSLDVEVINKAIFLLIYENIIVTLLFVYLLRTKSEVNANYKEIRLKGNIVIYMIYIIMAFIVFLSLGRNLQLFDFAIKPVGIEERFGDVVESKSLIIRQIIGSGFLFSFLIIVEKTSENFKKNKKKIFLYIAILSALFMVSIIVGERRTTQLYVGFATALTLIYTFPSDKKKIINIISTGVLLILILMTVYKHFNAFLYDSYLSAVQASSVTQTISANTLDSYFYGLNTVSRNIEFIYSTNLGLSNFIYDVFRNIFGLNYLIQKDSLTTSELYNSSIYLGSAFSGYLFSSTAYGFAYFGTLFAPISSILNIRIAFWLEKKMRTVKSIEMTYITAFIFMRFSFGLFSNPAPLLNFSTRYLFINSFIFLIAKYMFSYKGKK